MRKSLIVIASALILAVAAATHDRLRYDSSVFADSAQTGGPRVKQVEYPPCVRGVREDRCIQLYERGVRRSYQRWLSHNGRGNTQVADAAPAPTRAYRACRSRGDDRCQQRAGARRTRTVATRPAATNRRAAVHRSGQRAATRPVATRPAVRRAAAPAVRRAPAPAVRRTSAQRPATPAPTVRRRPGNTGEPIRPGGGTPGI